MKALYLSLVLAGLALVSAATITDIVTPNVPDREASTLTCARARSTGGGYVAGLLLVIGGAIALVATRYMERDETMERLKHL